MGFTMHKPLLMIPGPMDCPDEVLRRCGMPVFPHYEGDWPAFYVQLTERMKQVFVMTGEGYVFIPSGSGTTAVCMMLSSLVTPEDSILGIANGGFRGYFIKNCVNMGVPYELVDLPWGALIDPDKVRDAMKKKRHPFIYVTHNESGASVVNFLPPLGEIAREFDALLLVDAVSSVGGVVIDMDAAGADVVAGASQKCLEIPPGLAPIAVGSRAWEHIGRMKNRRVPYYLDVVAWKNAFHEMHDFHPQPVTGATNVLYALDWMVDRILEEGVLGRQERFRRAGYRLQKGMAASGFETVADPRNASPVVTEFRTPEGVAATDVRAYYRNAHDTMVGQGFNTNEPGRTFRIAHFGLAADDERIDHMIRITAQFMRDRA
jgi:aspartate aminotransferase-like enzyme